MKQKPNRNSQILIALTKFYLAWLQYFLVLLIEDRILTWQHPYNEFRLTRVKALRCEDAREHVKDVTRCVQASSTSD